MRTVAVLTGDLIGSSAAGADALAAAMVVLAQTVARMDGWGIGVDPRFTRSRGDGWQVLVAQAAMAPRAALVLTAALRAARLDLPSRIAIGIGGLDDPGGATLADAAGGALVAAGHGLDQMPRNRRFSVDGTGVTPLHHGFVQLCAAVSRKWTPEQAEAMTHALHPAPLTLAAIAARLGISAQAVNYRLQGAGGVELRAALAGWEQDGAAAWPQGDAPAGTVGSAPAGTHGDD